ncbi:MAG: hypothetical protein PF961_01945 [Planctomycetota bacterium]|jgi:hypothetical protein|nr:hypothetical protein [Planctomycetota bacterium]
MVENLLARLSQGSDTPLQDAYDDCVRDCTTAYLVTGDRAYAERSAALVAELLRHEDWVDRFSKGLTRAYMAVSVVLAYELCAPAWDADLVHLVRDELEEAAIWMAASMGVGANDYLANNWQGVRYAAVGLCALAAATPRVVGLQ